jgi:hypothetical protein
MKKHSAYLDKNQVQCFNKYYSIVLYTRPQGIWGGRTAAPKSKFKKHKIL